MSISSYTYMARPADHSPSFFDDLGKYPELKRQQEEMTNYYQQYSWIQSGDSFLRIIGKIALGMITLTGSLWAASVLDWAAQNRRKEAFDQRVEKDLSGYIQQIQKDIFRQDIYVDGQNLYEIGFEKVGLEDIPGSLREKFTEIREAYGTLREILDHIEAELKRFPKDDESTPVRKELSELRSRLYAAVEKKVGTAVLPGIYQNPQKKYGTLRALQIMDGLAQTISNLMKDNFDREYVLDRLMPEHDIPLGKGCMTSGECAALLDRKTHQVTYFDSSEGEFGLNRGLLFWTPGESEPRILAEVGVDFKMDLSTFTGKSITTITPDQEALTSREAERLNQVWGGFGFKMLLPRSESV